MLGSCTLGTTERAAAAAFSALAAVPLPAQLLAYCLPSFQLTAFPLPATSLRQDCTVRGSVHATEGAWAGILHPSNRLEQPEGPTDFPPEEGPFRFTPNPYTRKQ